MDVPAFLDWTRGVGGRWELHDGIPVEMQSERIAHLRSKGRAYAAFSSAIARRGLRCEALPDGATVLTKTDSVYIPDALVRCGDPLDSDAIKIPDPVIVVEVLSPSNTTIEMTAKIDGYFSLPSVAWVLLVDTETRVVHSYARGEDALLMRRHEEGDTLALDPPGIAVAVADMLPLPPAPAEPSPEPAPEPAPKPAPKPAPEA